MRVLLVHNSYRLPGGEDRVFETETEILRERGHQVFTYARRNPERSGAAVLRLAGQAFWNQQVYGEMRQLISQTRPDVVHLHNTFPLISPAACYAANRAGVATVQTLHNYRLLCPSGLFFRSGRVCEDCLHTAVPWPAVVHACYRGSYAASLSAAGTVAVHRRAGTWNTQVDRYIALTDFARQKFIAGGMAPDRLVVKPNVVHPDHGRGAGDGGYALFVGRLSPEKGVQTLLDAWSRTASPLPLIIAGDGPLGPAVRRTAAMYPGRISWMGHRTPADVQLLMGRAACVIVPSIWYETFGLVVAEAFARGTPVVAARLGALAELVDHGRTGLQFTPGDADDLVRQVEWLADHPGEAAMMRTAARAAYERRYAVETHYAAVIGIYADAISERQGRRAAS